MLFSAHALEVEVTIPGLPFLLPLANAFGKCLISANSFSSNKSRNKIARFQNAARNPQCRVLLFSLVGGERERCPARPWNFEVILSFRKCPLISPTCDHFHKGRRVGGGLKHWCVCFPLTFVFLLRENEPSGCISWKQLMM